MLQIFSEVPNDSFSKSNCCFYPLLLTFKSIATLYLLLCFIKILDFIDLYKQMSV